MRWMKWDLGRGDSGYFKMLLLEWPWWPMLCDLYLLYWPEGSFRDLHKDIKAGYGHYRVNFVLKKAHMGGEFYSERCFYNGKRLKIFRSDELHSVGMITSGNRYVLSLGFCIKEK